MFTQYKEYKDIIAWLASQGHPGISESNLSRWRKGGFKDWLRKEQKKRMDLIEFTLDVLEELVTLEQKKAAAEQSESGVSDSCTDPTILKSNSSRLPPLLGGGPESTLDT